MARQPGIYRLVTSQRHMRTEPPKSERSKNEPGSRKQYEQGDDIYLSTHDLRPGGDFPSSRVEYRGSVGAELKDEPEADLSEFDYLLDGNVADVKEALDTEDLTAEAVVHLRQKETELAIGEDRKPRKGVIEKLDAIARALSQAGQ